MLLTRHLPLREALNRIEPGAIVARLSLFARALQAWGHPRPMLAVAGFNPHAGEGGLLGREDADLVEPGVRASRERGLDVTGPLAPDSVFLQAAQGRFDGVLALYHDQAFIPVKLHAPERGLTVIAGLPYLRVSPAHGTAFDIAGTGRARPHNLIAALLQAASWAGRDR
jgi:4-hydroxythreonine-4-phosphate dehydrogenase